MKTQYNLMTSDQPVYRAGVKSIKFVREYGMDWDRPRLHSVLRWGRHHYRKDILERLSVSCVEADNMPKKRRSWCLPIEPWAPNPKLELQNVNPVLQIFTVSSNSQAWAPIINGEPQFWTLCSTGPTPKFTKTSKLNSTVHNESWQFQIHLSFFIIYYYILYVFYFYYILFLLYVILYYINCHNSIRIFLLYFYQALVSN